MSKSDEMLKHSEASSPPELVASAPDKEESKYMDAVASAPDKEESKYMDAGEVDGRCRGSENDEIIKELKTVRRQNFVTHCLLSVMIVLTAAWQLSEVSIMLKVKDGLNHPFRSFGNMLKKMVVPDMNGLEPDDKEHPTEQPPSLPSINIPEMPSVNVPSLQN